MTDTALARHLHDLLRHAQLGGAPDSLIDIVEPVLLRVARKSALDARDAEIRTLWSKLDYLRPGERETALKQRKGWSRAMIRRAIGPQRRPGLSQKAETNAA